MIFLVKKKREVIQLKTIILHENRPLNGVFAMNQYLKIFSDEHLVNVLPYTSEKFTYTANTKILRHAIKFLKTTEHFNRSLV